MSAATILNGTCSDLVTEVKKHHQQFQQQQQQAQQQAQAQQQQNNQLQQSQQSQTQNLSFGHNANMPVLQRDIQNINLLTTNPTTSTSNRLSTNDPLDQIDNIELVQQSDTTVHLIDEEHTDTNLSFAPIQNLLGVFEENVNENKPKTSISTHNHTHSNSITNSSTKTHTSIMSKARNVSVSKVLLQSPEEVSSKSCNPSPSSVDQFGENSSTGRDEVSNECHEDIPSSGLTETHYRRSFQLHLPTFDLDDSLKLDLPQPVINRCSFYSVIHGVNKAAQDMAAEDLNSNIEETKDEDSALVLAVNGPVQATSKREGPQIDLAVLDEEKFLLAAIENREEEELMVRACPASFAEAIGEVEPGVLGEAFLNTTSGHSANPLAVLASSRTQLWKPSRSWWEAKSGKNPWIEPKSHNKRWRYLWPLIHYHKFLAKCIKKLKRNNVDVKTSMSPVSAFLREEVCAVSDHLAAASKFTAPDWMDGLPSFNGWTNHQDEKRQEELSKIVKTLPMRSLTEPTDVDSPILRDQIDVCFLKALNAAREQMENGENRNYEENSVTSDFSAPSSKARKNMNSNQSFASSAHGAKPPRYGGMRGSRSGRSVSSQSQRSHNTSNRRSRYGGHNRMYSGYPTQDPNMMMPPPHMQQGMYHPQYNPSYHGGYVHGHYMPQNVNNTICGWNNHYGGNDFSNINMSMTSDYDPNYYANQYDPSMDHEGSFYLRCDESVANTSIASFNQFEAPHHSSQASMQSYTQPNEQGSVENAGSSSIQAMPNSANASFDEASYNGDPTAESMPMQTPCKDRKGANLGTPASPSWAHLHFVPGLGTPVAQHGHSAHQLFDRSENAQNNANAGNGGMGGSSTWRNAQPLLIKNSYNHFPQGGTGPIPPSPATQFTMSPQANSQNTAYFAHGYAGPNPQMQGYVSHMQSYPQVSNPNELVSHGGQTLTEETTSETTSDSEN